MKIELPYKTNRQKRSSNALVDFYTELDEVINFYQESLMMYCVSRDSILPKSTPERTGEGYGFVKYSIPTIKINKRDNYHLDIYPVRLFNNTIINIASCYELFVRDLAEEVYRYNQALLRTNEKQLTTEEILSFDSIEDLSEELIERSLINLVMSNYPDLVKKFERNFHVGLHSKKSPMTLFEMHHFLETRNIIVHNDSTASKMFFKRLTSYSTPSPLGIKQEFDGPEIDFNYLNQFRVKLIALAEFADNDIRAKWTTSEYEQK